MWLYGRLSTREKERNAAIHDLIITPSTDTDLPAQLRGQLPRREIVDQGLVVAAAGEEVAPRGVQVQADALVRLRVAGEGGEDLFFGGEGGRGARLWVQLLDSWVG